MKSVLLMCWMALLSVAVSAQDFASRFMAEHRGRFQSDLCYDQSENDGGDYEKRC